MAARPRTLPAAIAPVLVGTALGRRYRVAPPVILLCSGALLGLVPVAGDLLSAALGLYLVAQARELGASRWLQARMIGNLALDAALGVVPVAGDLADVWFKAHLRNLRLLQKELGEPYIDLDGPPSGHRR